MVTKEIKSKIGKKSRSNGKSFEIRTRKDLEEKGWIVTKWMNTIKENKCVPAKSQYNPYFKRIVGEGSGFPDFIAYKPSELWKGMIGKEKWIEKEASMCDIIFVESKFNGTLDKAEKEMAKWYLDNKYCSKFFIASKIKEKNKIKVKYDEF